jgi:hypothetical protein
MMSGNLVMGRRSRICSARSSRLLGAGVLGKCGARQHRTALDRAMRHQRSLSRSENRKHASNNGSGPDDVAR